MRGLEPSRKTIPPAARIGATASVESAMSMPRGMNARAANGRSRSLAQKDDPHRTRRRRKNHNGYGCQLHHVTSNRVQRSRRVSLDGSAAHARSVILNARLTYPTYGRSGCVRQSCILHAQGCASRKSRRNLRCVSFILSDSGIAVGPEIWICANSTNEYRMSNEFKCPKCQALYKVVRMNSDARGIHQSLYCRICQQPLAPTHEGRILKYFLVRRPSAACGA
jgi:hypothetical protein